MPGSRNFPHPSKAGLEPYHDDPTMTSVPYDDPRSPAFNSPRVHDSDVTQPPLLSIRSTVPLIPTPGTVSKRHPTYVRHRFLSRRKSRSVYSSIIVQEPVILRFWVVTLGCVLLGAIGIGLEIACALSRDNDGVSRASSISWHCANSTHHRRLLRPPEKCILLRLDSVLDCERCHTLSFGRH
jgi:hypothetical protein